MFRAAPALTYTAAKAPAAENEVREIRGPPESVPTDQKQQEEIGREREVNDDGV